jgi:hypothetical protein
MEATKTEPSVGELLGALARDTGVLVRQEVQLASNEVASKTSSAAKSVGVVLTGGAIVHAGFVAVLAAIIAGLGTMIPVWLAAALVGIVVAAAGYAFVQKGLHALKVLSPRPQQTIKTLNDDTVWAKEQLR